MAKKGNGSEEAAGRLWDVYIRASSPSDFNNLKSDQDLTTYLKNKIWGSKWRYSYSPIMDFLVEIARDETKVVTDKQTGASQTKPLLEYYDMHKEQRAARIQQSIAEAEFKERATKGLTGFVKSQRKQREEQLRKAENARIRSTVKAIKQQQVAYNPPTVRGRPTVIKRKKGFAAQLDVIKRQRATEKAAITRQLNPKQHIPTETKRPIVSAEYYAQHSRKAIPVVTNTLPTTKRLTLPNVEHKSRKKALSQFKR